MKPLLVGLLIFALGARAANAEAETWNLPSAVSDTTTTVTFSVATTWHTVHGTTSHLSGSFSLRDRTDHHSIVAEIHIPVAQFNTGLESRDATLRDSMGANDFPEVVFRSAGVPDLCSPAELEERGECHGTIPGTLTIRNVSQDVSLPYTLRKEGGAYRVSGEVSFSWLSFGVEDPSLLVARVDPMVTVVFTTRLGPGAA